MTPGKCLKKEAKPSNLLGEISFYGGIKMEKNKVLGQNALLNEFIEKEDLFNLIEDFEKEEKKIDFDHEKNLIFVEIKKISAEDLIELSRDFPRYKFCSLKNR